MTEKQIAINFLRWTEGIYSYSNVFELWYDHIDTNKYFTCEELYKLYEQTLMK
jgi:hypothetical protein